MKGSARTDLKDCERGRHQFACQVEAQLCLSCPGSICSLCIAAGGCGCGGRHWYSAERKCMLCTGITSGLGTNTRHTLSSYRMENLLSITRPLNFNYILLLIMQLSSQSSSSALVWFLQLNDTMRSFSCNRITTRFSSLC